jgi:hypothetical protein
VLGIFHESDFDLLGLFPNIFELFHTSVGFITYPYVVILSRIVVTSLDVLKKEDISCSYWESYPRSSSVSLDYTVVASRMSFVSKITVFCDVNVFSMVGKCQHFT